MNNDLIRRSDTLKSIANDGDEHWWYEERVNEVPAVDAVEVVHAKWEINWCDNNLIGHEYEECSNCGCSMVDTNQFWNSNYCPNCGARMDGESNE